MSTNSGNFIQGNPAIVSWDHSIKKNNRQGAKDAVNECQSTGRCCAKVAAALYVKRMIGCLCAKALEASYVKRKYPEEDRTKKAAHKAIESIRRYRSEDSCISRAAEKISDMC